MKSESHSEINYTDELRLVRTVFLLAGFIMLISIKGLGQDSGCVNPATVTLSSSSGSTCGTTSVTISGNTFGGSATRVYFTENGRGSVSPSSTSQSPFSFTYTPRNNDIGKTVVITVTTNNPSGPCDAVKATYTLRVNAIPTAPTIGTVTQPTCLTPTGSVVLSGLPASGSWTINPGAIQGTGTSTTVSGLTAGTYRFSVASAAGCTSQLSANVVINGPPASPASPVQTVDCSQGYGKAIVTVTAPTGSGLTYRLDGGTYQSSASFVNVADGSHTITVRNSSGCTTTGVSFSVSCGCQDPPVANAGSGGYECDMDFIFNASPTKGTGTWTKISGPGNAVFSPDNHQPNAGVTVDQAGSYDFSWTEAQNNCTSTDIVRVIFRELPSLDAGTYPAICRGDYVQFNAKGTGIFSWSPVTLVSNPYVSNPVATLTTKTTFTVTLTDQFGCQNSVDVEVEVREKPVANPGADQVLEGQFSTTMNAELAHDYETGSWSLISGTGEIFDTTYSKTSISGLSPGINKFLWSVSNGVCPPSFNAVTITVHDFIIPTLITPNMDGRNDYFVIKGLSAQDRTELVVFDRRGVIVYTNLDYDNNWDGVDFNNKPLHDDTYFYVLKTENGKSIKGFIVIRR
ncbi:MAG: gliding motility-associated C-terminal domain-containing protein [Bacteroidales bacterium]|nr:gliding motility-associated C-terminal domain-containing protein [Bacteroidales bacterium]